MLLKLHVLLTAPKSKNIYIPGGGGVSFHVLDIYETHFSFILKPCIWNDFIKAVLHIKTLLNKQNNIPKWNS